ncbi:hypothetical protein [Aquitalea magnusonii]|uniref:Uncharacterized protein n=1 Tax=Aquitalea magnusonii TaxID=332411 RepID=A0A318J3A0_9NEIS|nr:hypothetical protein [Aquitalea magnusonii]PXX42217.1 hypothetical protein DFR38_12014 [Aquitalea magnusonii]
MADVTDVLNALAGLAAGIVYPNGTAAPSISGTPVKIYPGWPVPNVLEADLAQQRAHISVFAHETERNTTRFMRRWNTVTPASVTLAAAVTGNAVALSGTVSVPQNVMLLVNGKPYAYAVQPADTLNSIAAALATLLHSNYPAATSTGSILTIPTAYSVIARVGGFATVQQEIGRIEKRFQLTIWADDPGRRSGLAQAIVPALMDTAWLQMPDGTAARLIYRGGHDSDEKQKSRLYKRDIFVTVEYAVTKQAQAAQVLAGIENITPSGAGSASRTV